MAGPGFVHLRVRSAYSLLEGALPVGLLVDLAKYDDQPAIAVTDSNNLFGALEFSQKAAGYGIQPIIGMRLSVEFGDREISRNGVSASLAHIVLIAQDEEGYRNLMALSSHAHLDPQPGAAVQLGFPVLQGFSTGLIALTGGPGGAIDLSLFDGKLDEARARLGRLRDLFGERLYVELQRHGLASERRVEGGLIDLADEAGLPLVATNDCYFARREDYEAHDALLCIADGRHLSETDRRQLTPEHYLKSRAEMAALFEDVPEALANSVEIARRCHFRPQARSPILPRFTANDEGDVLAAEAAECRRQAEEGLKRRLAAHGPAAGLTVGDYEQRLDFELGVIERMKYPGYFLIVADFIKWAKAQGIPVGPGRGSGAGSLVAYSLTITDLDPLRFGLFFERFLNPERVSMPDFDIDFCQERRDEVIRYVQERYGRERVAQIITFGTLQARGVMRDVGRVLEMPYGHVDKLTKLVPQNPANPVRLAQAIAGEPKLSQEADENPVVRRMLDIAAKLEGLNRHASTHAAGLVIGDRPLEQLVPLYRDPKSDMPVTQFNMKWVEQAGLVKFDFLGLKTLTVLQTAVALLAKRGIALNLSDIPLDDRKTFAALAAGDVVGVFQLESSGMRRAVLDMRPDRFEDLIALVALYRPGPMANIPVYCSRKHGEEKIEYIHPKLEPILAETFGVITYQEQVQQIARDLAGYSLGEADLLRRAMGKKIKSEMDAQRSRFLSGAVERGVPEKDAVAIFDACAKFAEYGFNKGHSAPYALISYQTAYMKANYPVEFLAASMTHESHDTDKLGEFREEARRLGIKVRPPSINEGGVQFDVEGGEIVYALAALKGVGAQAVEQIAALRGVNGRFKTLADFANALPPRAVNKRMVETFAAAGAFDCLGVDRAAAHAGADKILAVSQAKKSGQDGQGGLFQDEGNKQDLRLPAVEPWLPAERLQKEHDAIGFFLSGHPLDDYRGVLHKMRVPNFSEFHKAVRAGASAGRLAGVVLSKQERRTKTGNKIAILSLSDASGAFEAVCFQDMLNASRELFESGKLLLMTVNAEANGEEIRIRLRSVEPLDQASRQIVDERELRVFCRDDRPLDGLARRLGGSGRSKVSVVLLLDGGREVEIRLPGRFEVTPQIASAIKAVPGVVSIEHA